MQPGAYAFYARTLPGKMPKLSGMLILMSRGGAATLWLSLLCATAGAMDNSLNVPKAPFQAPYLPSSDSEVLQEVPSSADPAVLKMRVLRTALDAAPTI